ncbi:dihydrofolate reductase [Clostridium polyendosporum]|uniref:Dihydrofolate reductase n=1 Tax=Clostridium polyendosporum TaxID=69208 RepID=A0A919VGF7_9CLOT|nr:dihydrofolate reductase [Clostridium polyendosporum]GIM29340.1 dihydrofolate reductase [Clostridium polyendosporum]
MLSIIVAVAQNGVIGKNNDLIWHLPEDLKRFKKITQGHKIIMGRKTFDSLPGVLPNRHHIILTRDKNFTIDDTNIEVVYSVQHIIETYKDTDEEIFIIGGGEIYTQLLPHTNKLYLTKVKKDFEGDTHFPEINFDEWKVVDRQIGVENEQNKLPYEFLILSK